MQNWTVNMHLTHRKPNNQGKLCRIFQAAIHGIASLIFLFIAFCSSTGCVAQRGVDFGQWFRSAERVELVRVFINTNETRLNKGNTILLLPPYGKMPSQQRAELHMNLLEEMRNYFPVKVNTLADKDQGSEYLDEDNLFFIAKKINPQEVGRFGQMAGVSHVVCVVVNEFRAYQPMNLSLTINIIDCKLLKNVGEMNANLDCSEQQVVVALADYLQGRMARKMNTQSLETLLSSPSTFSAFASAKCSKLLADSLWGEKELKRTSSTADSK